MVNQKLNQNGATQGGAETGTREMSQRERMATQGRAQTEVGNKGKKRPEHDHAKCEHIRQDIHIQESRRRTPTYYI